ncbi:MAG: hypothetical protein WCV63_10700 [Negativicutes bacterium]
MKRVVLIFSLLLITSGAFAAPLTDYNFGRAAVDLFVTLPCIQATDANGMVIPSNAYGVNWGGELEATVGLGYHLAARIGTSNSFIPVGGRPVSGNYYFSKQNYDVLLGFQSDIWPLFVAVYAGGLEYAVGLQNVVSGSNCFSELGYHMGGQFNFRPVDNVTTYLEMAWGSLDTEALVGAAYGLNKNLELNLEVEYNALHGNDEFVKKYDANLFKIRSWIPKVGITYKF